MAIKSKGQTTARRSGRRYRPHSKPTISKSSSPPPPPLPESVLDIFFECGPFSVLCQGATDAEIAEDFKLLHAAIQEMAKFLLASAIPPSVVTFESPALSGGIPKNRDVSVNTCTLSASKINTRKSSRIKVRRNSARPTVSEPLTPESFDGDPILKDSTTSTLYDGRKDLGAVAPISFYGQLEVVEPAQLRVKRRGLSEDDNRIVSDRAKKPRSMFLS